jgi:hypothetical protein
MSPRLPRRVLTTVALMAALALPLTARAAAVRPQPAGPAFLEDLAQTFRHWFAHLWTGTFEKNGPIIDPDGRTTPANLPGGSNDNGAQTDPNG